MSIYSILFSTSCNFSAFFRVWYNLWMFVYKYCPCFGKVCLRHTLWDTVSSVRLFFYNLLWVQFVLVVGDYKPNSILIFDISLKSGSSESYDSLLQTLYLENCFPVEPGAQSCGSSYLVAPLWKPETSNSRGLGTHSSNRVSMENYPLIFSGILTHFKKWAVFSV